MGLLWWPVWQVDSARPHSAVAMGKHGMKMYINGLLQSCDCTLLSNATQCYNCSYTHGTICDVLADLTKACTIVFAMLYDDASLEQAAGEFLAAGPHKGTIFTNCATVYPGCTDALAKRTADAGVIFLSVPIFGRPDAILAHKGLLVSAGPEEGRQRV